MGIAVFFEKENQTNLDFFPTKTLSKIVQAMTFFLMQCIKTCNFTNTAQTMLNMSCYVWYSMFDWKCSIFYMLVKSGRGPRVLSGYIA